MKRMLWTIATTVGLVVAVPAWSAGGGGGGGGGGGSGGTDVELQDRDFQAGMAAVAAQDWAQVIARMGVYAKRNPRSADAFNELGHAYRRLGDMDNAFRHYETALKLNPKHRGAHEYLGEAYLQVGDLARAEGELKALNSICFLTCEEYAELKQQIERYKSTRAGSAR